MKCLDNSILSDYLRSNNPRHERITSIVESYSGTWYIPTPVLWEALRYGAQANRERGVRSTYTVLDWGEPLAVTREAVYEAALIEAALLDEGNPINPLDMLIGGVVKEAGGTIVTRDSDFTNIDQLDIELIEFSE